MRLVPPETGPLCEVDANMENGSIEDEIAGSIAERSKQAEAVIHAEEASMPFKEGQDHYLINARWWELWKAYAGVLEEDDRLACLPSGPTKEAPNPGPITNNELLEAKEDHNSLKHYVEEGSGYRVLSQGSWDYISKLYGGGPAMPRPVLQTCGKLRVEVRPLTLQVFKWPDYDKAKPLQISRRATVAELKKAACALFELDEKDVEVCDHYNNKIYASLESPEKAGKRLEEVQISGPQHIFLGEQSTDGKWPSEEPEKYEREVQRSVHTMEPRTPFRLTLTAQDDPTEEGGRARGLSGLGNLGNTCFMNSSLQCLSHAAPLVRTFLSGAFRQDLNRENPLGNKGELAEAFGSLLKLLWQGNTAFVSPRAFKQTVGTCAPQFSGYQQHDSQELLAFLLDGLHEDLNRVRQKPYIEEPDADGRPDEVVAKEVWNNYRKRNNSVIVDHFQGMYKSKLECPQCSHVGVKFDPYMYLSLNLPESKRRTLHVTALYVDGSQPPLQHAVDVPKTGSIGQVYEALARELGLPADQKPMELLLLIELQQHRAPIKFIKADALVSDIKERANLMVYRYASRASGPLSSGKPTHLFHRRRHHRKRGVSNKEQPLSDLIGAPLVLYLPEEEAAGLQLKKHLLDQWASQVWVQQPNVLDEALLTALRPFKKARADQNGHGSAEHGNGHVHASTAPESHAQSSKPFLGNHLGESLANGGPHSSMEPIRLPSSAAKPFGAQSEWPAFGMSSGSGAPPQSPAASPARSTGSAASDCASIQAQVEFNQPFSDDEDEGGQHIEGPHSKAQRLRGASQQSLTGLADANGYESAPQSVSAQDGVDTNMTSVDGWAEPGTTMGSWGQGQDDDGIEWEPADNAENVEPGSTVRNGSLEQAMHPQVTLEQTPQPSPERDAQPLETPLVPSKGTSRAQPFDMWAAQNGSPEASEQDDAAEMQAAERPAEVQFPWQLKCCSPNGETRLYNMPDKDKDLFFAVEWAPESAAQYDVSALERPQQSESSVAAAQREEERSHSSFTLQQCLESFVQKERLDSAEAWYCPKCKEHVQATKKLDLWSAPEVLILHLKRFQYTTQSRRKIDAPVVFPLADLDLSPYLIHQQGVPPVYDLFAISQHYGSLGGGHYTATCEYEGQGWYAFNDTGVSRVEGMDPADSARSAYVLFYRRQQDLRSSPSCLPPALETTVEEDNVMEDADEAQGTSLPGFPSRGDGHPLPGIMLGPVTANGNGFLYEHVPAGSESAVNVAVQDVVVSDASADGPGKEEALEVQSPDIPLSPRLQGAASDIPASPLLSGDLDNPFPSTHIWPGF